MKIGIIGAGAMGSIFAYFFNKANINTTLVEKDTNIKSGINVIVGDKTEKIDVNIENNPALVKGCGIVFIFVKTYDTDEAIKGIASAIDETSIIVSLQNGIGNKEIIAKHIPAEKIVYGSTSIGATRVNSNTIRLGGMGNNVIGGINRQAVKSVEAALKSAELEVTIADNPDIAVWKKAIINAGINPLGALLDIPNGSIISNEHSKKIQEDIVREAVNAALSIGIDLDPDEMAEQTRSVCEKTAKNLCSMLQDVKAKRRTEIDSINGVIIEYGKRNSIPTPYNDVIFHLIKAKESTYNYSS